MTLNVTSVTVELPIVSKELVAITANSSFLDKIAKTTVDCEKCL